MYDTNDLSLEFLTATDSDPHFDALAQEVISELDAHKGNPTDVLANVVELLQSKFQAEGCLLDLSDQAGPSPSCSRRHNRSSRGKYRCG